MSKHIIAAGRLPEDDLRGDPQLAEELDDLLRAIGENEHVQHGPGNLLCLIGKAQATWGAYLLGVQLKDSLDLKAAEARARVAKDSGSL